MTDQGVAARDPGGSARESALDAAWRRRNMRAVQEFRAMTLAKLAALDAADAARGGEAA